MDNVKKGVENRLKINKALPDDAILRNVCTFTSEDIDGGNLEVLGYMLNYGHSIEGINISAGDNGDYIKVFVNKKGIEYIKEQWSDCKIQSQKKLDDIKVNSLTAKDIIRQKLKQSDANRELADIVNIKSGKIVYVRDTFVPNKFIPAWEYEVGGTLMHIDCMSGEVIE